MLLFALSVSVVEAIEDCFPESMLFLDSRPVAVKKDSESTR